MLYLPTYYKWVILNYKVRDKAALNVHEEDHIEDNLKYFAKGFGFLSDL